jgi:hypothetical protein
MQAAGRQTAERDPSGSVSTPHPVLAIRAEINGCVNLEVSCRNARIS